MKQKLLFIFLCAFVVRLNAQITINEFLASNDVTIQDNAGEFEDWIELYNTGETPVNLSGYFLTDDLAEPTQWPFPDVTIEAKGFLLIWADKDDDQGPLHAAIKLSADGEAIGLYDGANYVDSLTFGPQTTDISMGRYPDGAANFYFFPTPTPGAANDNQETPGSENPAFSPAGGFYSGSVTVELSVTSPDATIRFTLDGSEPTELSALYVNPIIINETTPIRAKVFETGLLPSEIVTNTYIINANFDIATLSVVTDPLNLWDPDFGIYENPQQRGRDWERPASIEFFESNNALEFSANVGLRIHGGWTRSLEKKSFRYYFRSEYGQSWLNYQLFPPKELSRFKRFVTSASYQDSPSRSSFDNGTLIRNPLAHEIGKIVHEDLSLGTRPVSFFLNGEAWGIYNAIERVDDDYLETNFGITNGDIVENYSEVEEGSIDYWNEMISFIESHDLSQPQNYETLKSYLDIENFTHYEMLEIYFGNMDWPDNNNVAFCGHDTDKKWRWVLWDMDQAFAYWSANTMLTAISENKQGTLILRELLKNAEYKNYFINEFADLLNSSLLPNNVKPIINDLAGIIRNDVNFETDRWGGSVSEWENYLNHLRNFAQYRPDNVRKHIKNELKVFSTFALTIEEPQIAQGKVRVNSLTVNRFPWNGIYFKNVPVTLEALPNPGYMFVGWSDPSVPQDSQITIQLTDDYSVYPIFVEAVISYPITINEINYNSSDTFDSGDWIELHNYGTEAVDVSNWHFKDSDDDHDFVLPGGTTIPSNDFLVLAENLSDFQSLFPSVSNVIGSFDFGLSGGGEFIRLYDNAGNIVDSLEYDDSAPWPTEPDGNGPTLELISPQLDNTIAINWEASESNGSPGVANNLPTQPIIAVAPAALNFAAQLGGTDPAALQIDVTNAGVGTLNWSAAELPETAWLTLTTSANAITAQAAIVGLAAGSYNAVIQISSTNAPNSPVEVPVQLTISDIPAGNEVVLAEIQAESSTTLPNSGWKITANAGEDCIKPITSSLEAPQEENRLEYAFTAPAGISEVYVFAEVDVNNNYLHDSFWVKFNNADLVKWDNLKPLCRDGWKRAWVFNVDQETQHQFTAVTGTNVISFFPHTDGAFLNWLVITTDPNYDIENHVFGEGGSVPPPPPTDPLIAVNHSSLNFSVQLGGGNPPAQQINITNGGGGTLTWSAAESPETAWLSLNVAANSVSVQVNTNGLGAGTYNSTITITSANATNSPVEIPVKLTITQNLPPDESILAEFEAEHNPGLPNPGWKTWVNEGDSCLKAICPTVAEPMEEYRLDYKFYVPFGVTTVYVFAEVDVNNNYRKDSFWVDLNDADMCHWDNLKPICRDGWKRAWVFDADTDSRHPFAAVPDTNVLSIYPQMEGPFINWLVVTTDPDFDIDSYEPTAAMAKGNFAVDDDELNMRVLPNNYYLAQNYPNPFNPETRIDFDLPEPAIVSLEVFNLTGQRIAVLHQGELAAGHHSVSWNATSMDNAAIPSGVYLCRLQVGAFEQIIRMMLLK